MKNKSSLSPSGLLSELSLHIRGDKKTGKSMLFHRMTANEFSQDYNPTAVSQTKVISWSPVDNSSEKISITLTDVVNPSPRVISSGLPNGMLVLYDPRDINSVNYAFELINHTPETVPVALLTNFQDLITTDVHPKLRIHINRVFQVHSSMKTNLGLAEIAKWIELVRKTQKLNVYKSLYDQSVREINRLNEVFTYNPSGISQSLSTPESHDDNGFWSEDEEPVQKKKQHQKKKPIKPKEPTELYIVPKIVQEKPKTNEDDDTFMNDLVEAAFVAKTPAGKDEFDSDDEKTVKKPKSRGKKHHKSKKHPIDQQEAQVKTMPGYDSI